MSSIDVMLNGTQYLALGNKPECAKEWLEAWKNALKRKNFRDLLTLTHWGLQLPLHREKDHDSVTQLICHYLAVADGHQSAKNFGHHGPASSETDFSMMSHGERMQKLSDKAWMELCNRVFVFENDGFGEQLKYSWYFRDPSLAAAFICFINPERWHDGKFCCLEQANIDLTIKSAYHVKAHAFTCRFLEEAWQYREILVRENAFRKLSEKDTAELQNRIQFFRRLKPQLAKLIIRYGMADFLHDQKLDHPTRLILRDIAFNDTTLPTAAPSCGNMDLAKIYGHLSPEHGFPTLGYREVARVLLLYPYLVKGRRDYVHEQIRKKLAAKAAEAEQLQAQLKTVAAKLEALK